MKHIFLSLLLVTLSGLLTACGGSSSEPAPVEPDQSVPDTQPNYIASPVGFGQVLSQTFRAPDARLEYGNLPQQFGDLWLPDRNPESSIPLIILVHGGCWSADFNLEYTYPMATALATEGYAVWSLEFRRHGDPDGGWPTTVDDLQLAVNSRALVDEYIPGRSKTLLIGHSSGGHLGSLAAIVSGRTPVDGFIGLASINDIIDYAWLGNGCSQGLINFMGGDPDQVPDDYYDANPVNKFLNNNSLYLHGSEDSIVPPDQASATGLPAQIIMDAGHFDLVHTETEAFQVLLSAIEQLLNN